MKDSLLTSQVLVYPRQSTLASATQQGRKVLGTTRNVKIEQRNIIQIVGECTNNEKNIHILIRDGERQAGKNIGK